MYLDAIEQLEAKERQAARRNYYGLARRIAADPSREPDEGEVAESLAVLKAAGKSLADLRTDIGTLFTVKELQARAQAKSHDVRIPQLRKDTSPTLAEVTVSVADAARDVEAARKLGDRLQLDEHNELRQRAHAGKLCLEQHERAVKAFDAIRMTHAELIGA